MRLLGYDFRQIAAPKMQAHVESVVEQAFRQWFTASPDAHLRVMDHRGRTIVVNTADEAIKRFWAGMVEGGVWGNQGMRLPKGLKKQIDYNIQFGFTRDMADELRAAGSGMESFYRGTPETLHDELLRFMYRFSPTERRADLFSADYIGEYLREAGLWDDAGEAISRGALPGRPSDYVVVPRRALKVMMKDGLTPGSLTRFVFDRAGKVKLDPTAVLDDLAAAVTDARGVLGKLAEDGVLASSRVIDAFVEGGAEAARNEWAVELDELLLRLDPAGVGGAAVEARLAEISALGVVDDLDGALARAFQATGEFDTVAVASFRGLDGYLAP